MTETTSKCHANICNTYTKALSDDIRLYSLHKSLSGDIELYSMHKGLVLRHAVVKVYIFYAQRPCSVACSCKVVYNYYVHKGLVQWHAVVKLYIIIICTNDLFNGTQL